MVASTTVATAIVVAKTGILVLGGLITFFSYKAYRRTGAQALKMLAIGFGIVTLGSLLGGVLDQVLNIELTTSILMDSVLTLLGFVVIFYSLYAE
jgi:Tfp pilus assembly pilus retraction ATPase PilT